VTLHFYSKRIANGTIYGKIALVIKVVIIASLKKAIHSDEKRPSEGLAALKPLSGIMIVFRYPIPNLKIYSVNCNLLLSAKLT
jgi:hypothetical protein